MIASSTIAAVKDVPALSVIGQYVTLRKQGANYTGLCPFHDERTPSFTVSAVKNRFKCFGCGASGSAIQFVMDYEKKDFKEAVELIAGMSGIVVDSEKRTQRTRRTPAKQIKKVVAAAPFDIIPLSLIKTGTPHIASNALTVQIAAIVTGDVVVDTLKEYKISLNDNWITYPQIDIRGRLRTGKSVRYESDGHRANTSPIWMHNELKQKGKLPANFVHKQCFTGEHLISSKPVAIVEGQSTMLFMASLGRAALKYNVSQLKYFAGFTWVCTGGSDGIGWKDVQVLQALKGKDVVLFPDASFYDQWLNDAELMQEHGINVQVSQLIESKYNDASLKYNEDLRDYFMLYADDIKELCQNKTITISSEDVLRDEGLTENLLSEEFNNVTILRVIAKSGNYDLLFDRDSQLLGPGNEQLVKQIETFFEKEFKPGLLDNEPCFIHHYN